MSRTIVRILIVLVTLYGVAIGGAGDVSAQALLALVTGLFLLIAPPRVMLPRTPLLLAGLLLLISLLAFLPAGSSESSLDSIPWRKYLIQECHITPATSLGNSAAANNIVPSFPIDNTWTPQPWLTAQSCGMLFVGLAWMLYLLTLPWEREDRIRATELLVFGIALMALLSALAFFLHFHVPNWRQSENRGWFPNRNQTADALALAGVVTYALIFDRLRKGRRIGYLLLVALIPILTELVITLSRAGIILFFGGVLLWHLWPRQAGSRRRGASAKWLALSAAFLIVLLAVYLAWGGDSLARFQITSSNEATATDFTDFRGAIQQDAFFFSLQSPLIGTGLGNFEPLFSFSRDASINQNTAIHPESDWLWLACEMGWPAVFVVVAACIWWYRRTLPLENKAGESMRRALIVAVLMFIVHAFVDVSAHGTGTLWIALLLAGMALPTQGEYYVSRATPLVFRGMGVALLLIAGAWYGSLFGWRGAPPTTYTLARLQGALDWGKLSPEKTINLANAALKISPLDWRLYYLRGVAEILQTNNSAAQADFTTARALNPFWIELALDEGNSWRAAGQPDLAIDSWSDSLHRLGPAAPAAFREMIGLTTIHSVEREELVSLAFDRVEFMLLLLPGATLDEATALIGHLLQDDPQLSKLSAEQRSKLFAAWWAQGDQVALMQFLHDHPESATDSWLYEAQYAAKENDYRRACAIAQQHVQAPIVPQSGNDLQIGDIASDFASNPDNLAEGLTLAMSQIRQRQNDAALTTLNQLVSIPDHPRYISYLQAQLYAGKGDWVSAWEAWRTYLHP